MNKDKPTNEQSLNLLRVLGSEPMGELVPRSESNDPEEPETFEEAMEALSKAQREHPFESVIQSLIAGGVAKDREDALQQIHDHGW